MDKTMLLRIGLTAVTLAVCNTSSAQFPPITDADREMSMLFAQAKEKGILENGVFDVCQSVSGFTMMAHTGLLYGSGRFGPTDDAKEVLRYVGGPTSNMYTSALGEDAALKMVRIVSQFHARYGTSNELYVVRGELASQVEIECLKSYLQGTNFLGIDLGEAQKRVAEYKASLGRHVVPAKVSGSNRATTAEPKMGTSATSDLAVIERFIASQAKELDGSEYEGARMVMQGDLNNDGVPDAAVVYTIEGMNGGNNFTQYLSVFVRTNGQLVHTSDQPVSTYDREIESGSIVGSTISLHSLGRGPEDANCCFSLKGILRFALSSGALKELK